MRGCGYKQQNEDDRCNTKRNEKEQVAPITALPYQPSYIDHRASHVHDAERVGWYLESEADMSQAINQRLLLRYVVPGA